MAPSSQVWNHDVYISFLDKDTGHNFVGFLHEALQRRGIHSYIYTESLPHGAVILPTLYEVIEESRIVVVVLSKNYAYSSFCLQQLVKILDCKKWGNQTVMPIFLYVDPSDVRNQRGAYGDAIRQHEHKNSYNVKSWSEALAMVSNLSGFDLGNQSEITFLKAVVEQVSNELLPNMGIGGCGLSDLKSGNGDSLIMVPSCPSYYTRESSFKLGNHSVFLSFHREDTRKNFVDHLYAALDHAEILTYMDENTLPLDKSLTPSYIKSIEESQIAVIIFSQNYAASSWCLDELVNILKYMFKRGKTVMPVYYGVDPLIVSKQVGVYEKALETHGRLEEATKVGVWREAVEFASGLHG